MTRYECGDVVLVDIAFSGADGRKRRPAVVVSTEAFNSAGVKLIVAAMTSNVSPPFRPGEAVIDDWRNAGLLKPSAVRGVIATVDKRDVARRLGRLAAEDLAHVSAGIADILGFVVDAGETPSTGDDDTPGD